MAEIGAMSGDAHNFPPTWRANCRRFVPRRTVIPEIKNRVARSVPLTASGVGRFSGES
jgi:hypothetical protein